MRVLRQRDVSVHGGDVRQLSRSSRLSHARDLHRHARLNHALDRGRHRGRRRGGRRIQLPQLGLGIRRALRDHRELGDISGVLRNHRSRRLLAHAPHHR